MEFNPQKNYYEILALTSSASLFEIRKQFRSLCLRHHPGKLLFLRLARVGESRAHSKSKGLLYPFRNCYLFDRELLSLFQIWYKLPR